LLAAAIAAFLLMAAIMILQFDGLLVPGLLCCKSLSRSRAAPLALVLSRVGLNAIGLVAFLTLVGICLNHGIVLLYRARRNEAEGMAPDEAVKEPFTYASPIALTTLTAVLGMLPTALGWGQGAAPEQGLASVVLGGILWSALLSTNLLPALYLHMRRKTNREGGSGMKRSFCPHWRKLTACLLGLMLSGCASYHSHPLPTAPDLARVPELTVPARQFWLPGLPPHPISPDGLDETTVVMLAVFNNPDLKAARLQAGVASAHCWKQDYCRTRSSAPATRPPR